MALAEKFLFDFSFDAPGGGDARQRGAVTPAEPVFTRVELDAATAQARGEGHAAGMAEALSQREQQVGDALSAIAGRLGALLADKASADRESERNTIELTRAIASKLFPALLRKGALAELEAVVVQCMHDTIGEPRLVLRVPDAIFEAAQQRIAPLAASNGYPGKVIILVDEALGESDCRVEWADGGAERDTARSWRDIDTAITRALSALNDGNESSPQTSTAAPQETVT
jgi:flagellar assembly protein FliH